MIKEILINGLVSFIPSKPSEDLESFVDAALNGENRQVPTYGKGLQSVFDYYSKSSSGDEQGRLRVPWNDKSEKSYHIKRTPQGNLIVTVEGFFPLDI